MKKILSLVIVLSMLLSSVHVFGAAVSAQIDEPTPEMMEEMIKRVRPLIDVPEEYKEFGWDFYENSRYSSNWNFYWTDNTNGEINVSCDTEGRIMSYNVYSYKGERKASLPSVSPESLLPVAEEFLKETAPFLNEADLRLTETAYPSVFYNQVYTYTFTRYENDIPVPENIVRVSVNHVTGEVESYSATYNTDAVFNAPKGDIGSDKAKEILGTKQKMVLSYRLLTEYNDEGELVERRAYLVYTPEMSYISVDAASGEIYTERNTWQALKAPTANGALGGVMMDSMSKEESASSDRGYQLTEEELAQVALLESLITKDEAAKVIFEDKDLFIHENAYLSDARLTKRYSEPRPLYALKEGESAEKEEKYVWNLSFRMPGETYLGMSATVDAHDGALISYSADMPSVYQYEQYDIPAPEATISREKAKEIAGAFIKKHQPEKWENVVYSSFSDYAPIKYIENKDGSSTPIYRANNFIFVRQNEGIDFTYNSFGIGVDRASGKITRYSYTWYDDIIFESPKDAVTPEEALSSLYNLEGFGKKYEINTKNTYIEGEYDSVKTEICTRAVYSLTNAVTTTIRALDAKPINYNNEEILPETPFGIYSDIENHWAKDTIERFTWIGYGPEGDKFRPDEEISGKDFVSLCETVRIYGDSTETTKLDSLTRMNAVKLIIDHLGYGKIAGLKNVFITDFADNSDFIEDDIGYAAIARGFGIIEGDGENFRPYDTLTRAEALTVIENAVNLGILNN